MKIAFIRLNMFEHISSDAMKPILFGIILNFQIIGVWMAMISDWTARSCAFIYRFKSGKWKEKRAI